METLSKPQLRSTSLPSRLTPASSSLIVISLNKIQTLAPFYTSASIHSGLVLLPELYLSIDQLISSSQIQQVSLQNRNKSLIEDALDGSALLLDSGCKLAELLALVKENVRNLQFGLGRKGVGAVDANCEAHISDYFLFRKKAKKNIVECLGTLETMEEEMISSRLGAGENRPLSMTIGLLREIVVVTISVFRAMLICLSGKRKLEKGFSFVTKLMPIGRPSCDKSGRITSDVDIIDVKLRSLCKNIKKNESKAVEVQIVTDRLQNLDHQIEVYEAELDSVFRKLIQTRVSLLNILTN